MPAVTMQTLPRTTGEWVGLARSGPTDAQRPALTTAIYRLWLVAFVLKMLGSTWDMSWHFKWLRDTAAPPHVLNTIGTVIVVALVIFQARYSVGVDKWAKRLMVFGTGMFLIAIPIDILNHEINGLDITAWSSSHALLYGGTAFMLLGCARGYWISTPAGRTRTIVSATLWGFFLENILFANQHQEYGALSLAAWLNGNPTAEPILLEFAARQLGMDAVNEITVAGFALPVPDQVYPAWIVGAGLLTLVAARYFVGARFTATAIAAGYIAYRILAWILLTGTGFPPSYPPFLLIGGAVMIDLVFLTFATASSRARLAAAAIFGTCVATGATAATGWLQDIVIGAPPIGYLGYLWGGLALLVGWVTLALWRPTPRPATLNIPQQRTADV
jgi:hypothetical protein